MNWNDFKYWFLNNYSGQCENNGGCGPVLAMMALLVLLFCGCATKKSTESVVDYQRMEKLQERMDSLFHATNTWQQSIFEKQTSLFESFKEKEVSDTSHTVFLGEKGDTVREKIIIQKVIEREHTSEAKEKEYYQELFKQTDSLLHIANSKIEKLDSAYHADKKDTVVEKKPSIFDKLKYLGGGFALGVIGLFCCATAFMRKNNS